MTSDQRQTRHGMRSYPLVSVQQEEYECHRAARVLNKVADQV